MAGQGQRAIFILQTTHRLFFTLKHENDKMDKYLYELTKMIYTGKTND